MFIKIFVSYLILKIEKTISAIKNVKPGIVVSTAATKDGDPSLIDFWAKAKAIKLVISIKTNNLMEEPKSPPLVFKVDLTFLKTSGNTPIIIMPPVIRVKPTIKEH